MTSRSVCNLVAVLVSLFAPAALAQLSPPSGAKDVLVLHSFGRDFKPWSEYARAIRLELERQSPWPLNIHDHSLASARSDDKARLASITYINTLFSQRPPDLVVVIGGPAALFVQQHRAQLLPGTPMMVTAVDQRRVQHLQLGQNDIVVAVGIDYPAVVANILEVMPKVDHIAMVFGVSPIERLWKKEIEQESKRFEGRIKFTWYDALPFEDILKHAAALPPNSAIFWALMIVDAAGVVHEEGMALSRLHAAANAPIFSYTDAFFGQGIVVGARILSGESAGAIKLSPIGMGTPKFDWRELQRWGIPESRLPAGSEVRFRSPTFWEQYRAYLVAALAVILLQTAAIVWLVYEHRRRQAAEMLARGMIVELNSANRLAIAGELSASIAHEVRQPLTTVASNAYAALNWLSAGRQNLDEARKSLNQIVAAAHRANDIVSEARAMFSRDDQNKSSIDINELIVSVLSSCRVYLRKHGIVVKTDLAKDLPPVEGYSVQLQQLIHNLLLNAVEAMQEAATRTLQIHSAASDSGGVTVIVEDSGSGIDPANQDRIFKPLFTTKPRGMGMGLSICKSIVDAHGGRISVVAGTRRGARFEIKLPTRSLEAAVPNADRSGITAQ